MKFSLLILLVLWFVQVLQLIQEDAQSESAQEFNPYDILGVPTGSFNTPEVKKSFRKLALQYHPDKNIDDMEKAEKNKLIYQ